MFTKFKDSKGNFEESLINDATGMLSLYKAAHLRVHGEDVLEEALVFTTTHLELVASHLSPLLASQVSRAIKEAYPQRATKVGGKVSLFYLPTRCFT
jgi:hypothetical protein